MNICYVPIGAESHNDVLNLNECMQVAIRYARRNKRAIEGKAESLKSATICKQCGQFSGRLEVHHIKPMWVYALELVLAHDPQSRRELAGLASEIQRGRKNILQCHDRNNLLPLCPPCHDVVGDKADEQWKSHFQRVPRLFFGIRKASEIEKLLVRNSRPTIKASQFLGK